MKGYIATSTHVLLFDGPLRGITALNSEKVFLFDNNSIDSFIAAAKRAGLPSTSGPFHMLLIQAVQHRVLNISTSSLHTIGHDALTGAHHGK